MTINKAQGQSLGTVDHGGHGRSEVLMLHLRLSLGMILTKSNDKHITVIQIPFRFKVVCTVDYGLTKRYFPHGLRKQRLFLCLDRYRFPLHVIS